MDKPITYNCNLKPASIGSIAAALLLSLTFVSCSNQDETAVQSGVVQNPTYGEWQDREQPPIRFELEQTFGTESDEDGFMFASSGSIVGPVADESGNLYMLDRERAKLLSFDSEGNFRWKVGQEGKGPGDILRPSGITIGNSSIYFDNVDGSRIDQYDLNGNFIRSMPLSDYKMSFFGVKGFLNNGLLVGSSTVWGTLGNKISVFNVSDSLAMVSQFDVEVLSDIEMSEGLGGELNVSVFDSLIAFGNFGNYAIRFYNQKGKQIKQIYRDFDKLIRPGIVETGSSRAIRIFGSLRSPAKLSDQYFIALLSWPTNVEDPDDYLERSMKGSVPDLEYSTSLDLFRNDGTLLYSLEQNQYSLDIGNISYVDNQGNLYTRTGSPYPQVRRYEVMINDNGI